jgi:hypothetical protein
MTIGFASKVSISFTPGFSLVTQRNTKAENRFNGLPFFSSGNR